MSTSEDPSGTSTSRARDAASTPQSTCLVEVEVSKGHKSLGLSRRPTAVRINGLPVPNVISVDALYHAGDARRVVITLIPTDFAEIEIGAESEQSSVAGDTVEGP